MMREIDPEYYGYLDDEDYLLLPQEEKCEMAARKEKIAQFKATLSEKNSNSEIVDMEPETKEDEPSKADFIDVSLLKTFENFILNNCLKFVFFFWKSDEEERVFYEKYFTEANTLKNNKLLHLDVPTMKQIEDAILEKKKKELLSKYVSDEQMESETQVKQLSGKI